MDQRVGSSTKYPMLNSYQKQKSQGFNQLFISFLTQYRQLAETHCIFRTIL